MPHVAWTTTKETPKATLQVKGFESSVMDGDSREGSAGRSKTAAAAEDRVSGGSSGKEAAATKPESVAAAAAGKKRKASSGGLPALQVR